MDSPVDIGTETLIASWTALVKASDGIAVSCSSFTAARCRHPVFNNALLLEPEAEAIPVLARFYGEQHLRWSLWTGDSETSTVASQGGMVRDGGTTHMVRTLDDLPPRADRDLVVSSRPETVAEINGLAGEVVRDAAGFDALATEGDAAGLMMFRHGDDVQVSFVATRPEHRQQGLATALVTAALHDARTSGAKTVTLQATPAAVPLYERLGFWAAGEWREWVLAA